MKNSYYKKLLEQYCRIKNLSPLTLQRNLLNLKTFTKWLGRKELTKQSLIDFIIYSQDKGWKPATINSAVSTLKVLCSLLYERGDTEVDLATNIHTLKVEPFNPILLTIEEIERIINCPRVWSKYHKWVDRRKYDFFFELLARCALRRAEAQNLRVQDFNFEDGTFRIIGKGNKIRTIPIPDIIKTKLYLWFMERKARPEDWVFMGTRGGKVGIATFRDELKKRIQLLGINKRVHFHLFRHTWITEAIKSNLSTEKIMAVAGHSSFKSYSRYIHLTAQDCKDTMEKHPLNRIDSPTEPKSPQIQKIYLTANSEKPS